MTAFLLKTILLAVFNIAFWTITKGHCVATTWVGYGFIHFSLLMIYLSPLFTKRQKEGTGNFEQSAGTGLLLALHFVAQVAALFVFLAFRQAEKYQIATDSAITGAFLVFLILSFKANEDTAQKLKKSAQEKQALANLYIKLEFLKSKKENPYLQKKIALLQEAVKYSPTKSSDSVNSYEVQIAQKLDEATLRADEISDEDLEKTLKVAGDLLKLRNEMLKKRQ